MGRLSVQLPVYSYLLVTLALLGTLISLLQNIPWSRLSANRKKHSLDQFDFTLEFESLDSAL